MIPDAMLAETSRSRGSGRTRGRDDTHSDEFGDMPLIRSTIAVAIIFAYSPVHETLRGDRSGHETSPHATPARVESLAPVARPPASPTAVAPIAVPLPPELRPRIGAPDSVPPASIADLIRATAEDAQDAHALWRSLPEDTRSDLTRLITQRVITGDTGENR